MDGNNLARARAVAAALRRNPDVSELDLTNGRLGNEGSVILAEALQHCPKRRLVRLILSCNSIGDVGIIALAGAIQGMTSLEELYLDDNRIGEEGAIALGRAMVRMTGLRILNLDNNSIGSQGVAHLVQVEMLNEMPLNTIDGLRVLHLDNNNIGDSGVEALAGSLQDMVELEVLSLSHNSIGDLGASDLAEAFDTMTEPSPLQVLNLGHNALGPRGAEILASTMLPMLHALEMLSFDSNSIGPSGASALAHVLPSLTTLQIFHLDSNDLQIPDMVVLLRALQHVRELEVLHLSNNLIGPQGVRTLSATLRGLTLVRELYLENTFISDEGAATLALAFRGMTSLQVLNLSSNDISVRGTGFLVDSLLGNTSIRKLYLQNNPLREDGAVALAHLTRMVSLHVLDLGNCQIHTTTGIRAIADALRSNFEIQQLYFQKNQLREEDAVALAEVIQGMSALQVLNLASCKIRTSKGIRAVANALRGKTAIQKLYLFGNHLQEKGAIAIAGVIRQMFHLRVLDLGSCGINTSAGIRAIVGALRNKTEIQQLFLQKNLIQGDVALALAGVIQEMPALQVLHLGGCGIHDIAGMRAVVEALRGKTAIQKLYFYGIPLREDGAVSLGEVLQGMTALQVLEISSCHIHTSTGMHALSGALRGMTEIQQLYLYGNYIQDDAVVNLAETIQHIHMTELEVLDLGCCNIRTSRSIRALIEALRGKKCAHSLFLYGNHLGEEGAVALAGVLRHMGPLKVLDLGSCEIHTSTGIHTLANALREQPSIEKLHLHGNRLREDGALALAEVIQHMNSLVVLDLGRCEVHTSRGIGAIAEALRGKDKVRKLFFQNNHLGEEGVVALAEVIRDMVQLEVLDFGSCEIHTNIGTQALVEALREKTLVQQLYLQNNRFREGGAVALAGVIEGMRMLRVLHLASCEIHTDTGISALAEALRRTKGIQKLYLYGNRLGEEGIEKLAGVIRRMASLQVLDLGCSEIQPGRDMLALTRGLRRTRRLQELYLQNNHLREEGAVALAEVLQPMTALRVLSVSGCGIQTNAGIRDIAQALRGKHEIQELYLNGNHLGEEGAIAFAQVIQGMTLLQLLDVTSCELHTVGGIGALAEALRGKCRIQKLYFRTNHFGEGGGMVALSEVIQDMTALQVLDIGDCRLQSSRDIHALADAIRSTTATHVLKLNLSHNLMGDEEAFILAEGIQARAGPVWLDIDGNNSMSRRGRDALRVALRPERLNRYYSYIQFSLANTEGALDIERLG